MSDLILTRLTKKGQMTVPRQLREKLKIKAGDYVALHPMLDGFFVSRATVEPSVTAEQVLRHVVISLGKAAAERGITEDEDLHHIVEDIQQRVYEKHYG